MVEEEIVNKVAKSGLITINLEEMYPEGERVGFDLKDLLWQGLALREKDFRDFLKEHDWSQYQDKYVAVFCSVDAIIPHWAYMLVSSHLTDIARFVYIGGTSEMETAIFKKIIEEINVADYTDQRLVIKGCSDRPVPQSAYADLVFKLQPVAKSIMFGEPCSTVPVFKRK
ncbi:MAG: DUF2480 family protein [Flavobacteriales bacterium]|jgi:hypothetical protein